MSNAVVDRTNEIFQIERNSQLGQISSLQLQLQEKLTLVSQLETTVERIQSERPDSKNLIASIESDKIAASRAMSQNQDLKQQLEEMQKAFVQVVREFRTHPYVSTERSKIVSE